MARHTEWIAQDIDIGVQRIYLRTVAAAVAQVIDRAGRERLPLKRADVSDGCGA
jgi:hypothetical protein